MLRWVNFLSLTVLVYERGVCGNLRYKLKDGLKDVLFGGLQDSSTDGCDYWLRDGLKDGRKGS